MVSRIRNGHQCQSIKLFNLCIGRVSIDGASESMIPRLGLVLFGFTVMVMRIYESHGGG